MEYWIVAAVLGPAIGIIVARRYRERSEKEPLDWALLRTFLAEESNIVRFDIAEGGRIALEVSVQLQDELDRARYKRSRNRKGCMETLEAHRRDAFDLVVTFLNEEPVQCSFRRGRNHHYPQFPPEVREELVTLLRRLRNFVDSNKRN